MAKPKKMRPEDLKETKEELQAEEFDAQVHAFGEDLLEMVQTGIAPQIQAAQEALAEARAAIEAREKNIVFVAKVRLILNHLENEPGEEYYRLLEEKRDLEKMLNAKSRKVEGISVYTTPQNAEARARAAEVDKRIGEIKKAVTDVLAGFFGINADAAFEMVRKDDAYYASKRD